MVSVSQWTAWLLAGVILAAGLGLAAVLYTGQRGGEPVPAPPPAPSPSAEVSEPAPDPQPEPQVPSPAPPAFDVVRVAGDGGALVAGSALAGSAVVLRVDGAPVAETSADSGGQFVSLFTLAPSDAVQVMTLEMMLADGRVVLSDDRVVLAPRPEAVAEIVEAAPESVALALLQPEPPALPVGATTPAVNAAVAVAQAPGHEAASGALGQTEPPADDSAGVPAAGRDLPPAPSGATEVTATRPVVETADEPTAETLAAAGTEEATGMTIETATRAATQSAIEDTTETTTEAATENTTETATGPATGTDAGVTETAAGATTVTSDAPDIARDALQAMMRVPGPTTEVAAFAPSDGAAPRTVAPPEIQEPGLEAAATAVLESRRVVVEAGAEAPVAVGQPPEPSSEPAAVPATSAPQPRETPSAETITRATEPIPAPRPVEASSSQTAARAAELTPRTAETLPAEAVARGPEPAESLVPRAFLLRGSGAVDLLDRAPEVMDNIVIDMISYSDAGDVRISGRAVSRGAGTRVQIYLDNRPIALALAENGDWSSDLPAVDPGVYALRVDQLDGDGRVISRFETPFQREDPALVRAARAGGTEVSARGDARETASQTVMRETQDARDARANSIGAAADAPTGAATTPPPDTTAARAIEAAATVTAELAQPGAQQSVALMTVQPGHSLWRISEGHYGAGDRYLLIYNANRGQIRNPDLIYPGQIFVLPE